MKHQEHWLEVIYIAAALAFALPSARAASTWDTAGSGDKLNWSDANNWNPAGVPGDGAEVVITNGSVLLTNATYNLASLTITGATTRLTFSNWDTKLSASNVIIQSGATVTHVTNSAATTNALGEWPTDGRVWIVGTNLDLQEGGQIDAYGRGFRGAEDGAYIIGGTNGYGPGGGLKALNYGGGAGHGATGGYSSYCAGGPMYGLTNAPVMPGSGGGGNGGGAGGGAVRIEMDSGSVTINGGINASGNKSPAHGGAGSGGSVYITCRTFAGTASGIITARGGTNNYAERGGNGSGGRIAVVYDPAAQAAQASRPDVRFNVACGTGGKVGAGDYGDIGTLYLTDETILQPDLSNFEIARIYGVTNWSPDSLSVTNRFNISSNNIIFSAPRFTLAVSNTLLVDSAILQVGDRRTGVEYVQVACGDLQLACRSTNQSRFYVCSGPTNGTANYGTRVTVASDIVVASNSWICPASECTNGGPVFFTARNVTIAAGGGFDATGLGYYAGRGIGKAGYGPGGAPAATYYGGGGGYGGKGGPGSQGAGGNTYPWTNAPLRPGSGGGGNSWGDGGGLVWIEAGTVTVDGTIRADGAFAAVHGGGGSGGGILIWANKFRGAASGQLTAIGGSNVPSYNSGGGGGGRIAVWQRVSPADRQTILADPDNAAANVPRIAITNDFIGTDFAGSFSAMYGVGKDGISGYNGVTGTVVRLSVPPPKGTIFSVR
ncbi:MAG: hypothetical protein PHW60_11975 [Kiritimatiellae bacterium]|nr:hypothetical protein [Kiritimatiellia bacterium]